MLVLGGEAEGLGGSEMMIHFLEGLRDLEEGVVFEVAGDDFFLEVLRVFLEGAVLEVAGGDFFLEGGVLVVAACSVAPSLALAALLLAFASLTIVCPTSSNR